MSITKTNNLTTYIEIDAFYSETHKKQKSEKNKDFVTQQMLRSYPCDLKNFIQISNCYHSSFAHPIPDNIKYVLLQVNRSAKCNNWNVYYYFNGGCLVVTFED